MGKLLGTAGFSAYLLAIFLNAFVDLGHKITIQNTLFKVYDGETQIILTAIVNALILIPFVLLFTPSGYLADKYPKNRVMRYSAWLAVVVTLGITLSYYQGWFWVSFALTFVLAVQSATLSPSKYGYIRELVGADRLATANGLVQATTTTAILGGIFAFSVLFEAFLADHVYTDAAGLLPAIAPLGWILVAGSLLEVWFTYRLPGRRETDSGRRFAWPDYFKGRSLNRNLGSALANPVIRLSIIGLSIFWALSQVVLAVFPSFAKQSLVIGNTVVIQGLLACSGLGIILGSLIASRVSRAYIETGLIPLAALGIAGSLFIMPGLDSVLLHGLNFLLLGTLGGLFIVPLNALIQFNAGEDRLGQVLAADNLVQNQVMLLFLGATVIAAMMQISAVYMLLGLAAIALLGGVYTLYKLPQSMIRLLVSRLISTRYRLKVRGLEHLPAEGGVLLLGNHISWLDWAMLQMASPRPVRFVMERSIYERWYLQWFLDFFRVIPITSGSSRQALATVRDALRGGEVVCLFPEGMISRSGQLAEFRSGFERAVEGAQGVILPFYLRGLWGSPFSRAGSHLKSLRKRGLVHDVMIHFGRPMALHSSAAEVKQSVRELSVNAWQSHAGELGTLPAAWLERARLAPGAKAVMDAQGTGLSNRRLFAAVQGFSRLLEQHTSAQNIGVLLPASSAGAIVNMAVLKQGRTVVNLNYTAPAESLRAAIQLARLDCVYTSRRFIRKLEKKGVDIAQVLDGLRVHLLEDMQEKISKPAAAWSMLMFSLLPAWLLKRLYIKPVAGDATAAILFSSGSEGKPKGVELSHRNIMANLTQVSDVLDTRESDVVMATLPLFHAFGLTVTTFMPLVEGIPMVCHPDPTDAVNVAKAIARHKATIFCGTSTFLRLYARNRRVHPLMLDSLRIVVAGAERLDPVVRDSFSLKFGKPIYEGYGTTETTPVASVNLPDRLETARWRTQVGSKPASVGMPLPGTSFRIVDPDSLQTLAVGEDGLILIGGVQVMKGYLGDTRKTAAVIVELDGQRWYKTGDKGHLDKDGFLSIVDRYSRFAKVGGEMISLSLVEQQVRAVLPQADVELVAVSIPDQNKGEQILLLIDQELATSDLREALLAAHANPLTIPAKVLPAVEIPRLGSGKTDFGAAKKLAQAA